MYAHAVVSATGLFVLNKQIGRRTVATRPFPCRERTNQFVIGRWIFLTLFRLVASTQVPNKRGERFGRRRFLGFVFARFLYDVVFRTSQLPRCVVLSGVTPTHGGPFETFIIKPKLTRIDYRNAVQLIRRHSLPPVIASAVDNRVNKKCTRQSRASLFYIYYDYYYLRNTGKYYLNNVQRTSVSTVRRSVVTDTLFAHFQKVATSIILVRDL